MSIPALTSTPLVLYFKGLPAQIAFGDMLVIKDGTPVSSPAVTLFEISTGLYSLTYTPLDTGIYMFYIYGQIIDRVEVVSKSIYTYLKNIEDESLGSWSWDKVSGVLTLLKQDGTYLSSFDIIDTALASSRERIIIR